jgi:hypothetical protein
MSTTLKKVPKLPPKEKKVAYDGDSDDECTKAEIESEMRIHRCKLELAAAKKKLTETSDYDKIDKIIKQIKRREAKLARTYQEEARRIIDRVQKSLDSTF